jgi:hypothetical protein
LTATLGFFAPFSATKIDAEVENQTFKKWREPAQASVLSIWFIASHRDVDVEVLVGTIGM